MTRHVLVLGTPWSRPNTRGLPPRHKQLAVRLHQFWLAVRYGYRLEYARRGFNRLLKVACAWGMEVREHPDRVPASSDPAADPMADFRRDPSVVDGVGSAAAEGSSPATENLGRVR